MATPYTVGYLIGRCKNLLLGTTREPVNRLTSNIGTTDTSLALDFNTQGAGPALVAAGDIIAIDDELMYVWSSEGSSTGSTITVVRGWNYTTAASHNSGATVYVNPSFSIYEVRNAIKDEIRSWGPQVFAVKTADLTTTDFVDGYDLGVISPFYSILEVRLSPDVLISSPDDKLWPVVAFDWEQNANTADFPSGNALFITEPGAIFDSPRTVHVKYAAPFDVDTTFQDTDDLVNTIGLDPSDLDIPVYGVAWRLLSGVEIRRDLNNAMGSSADDQEHPATAAMQVAMQFKKVRDDRLRDAQVRLRAITPLRRSA